MRLALGASRGWLVQRLLTEPTCLSLWLGAGMGLAVWLRSTSRCLPDEELSHRSPPSMAAPVPHWRWPNLRTVIDTKLSTSSG